MANISYRMFDDCNGGGDKLSFKKVLLVKPSGRHGLSFAFDIIPTGLEYIAAYIEDVVDEVNIIDLEMEPKPVQRTLEKYFDLLKPDLVGISMSATEHREGLEIAQHAKNRGIMTVLGGYHPLAIPDELLSHQQVDFVVRGEGELTMHELVTKGNALDVNGISYKENGKIIHNPDRGFIEDLDSLPLPARHLRRYKYYLSLTRGREYDVITTSRGCWGRCSFCCEPTMSGSNQRYRSPENVMSEILEIVKFHKENPLRIEITDPHFMGKPKYVEELCDMLEEKKLDILFIAKVRPDSMAKHPEIVRKMIAVGIDSFEMGIESPHIRDLNSTSKGLKVDVHTRAVENITNARGVAGGTFVIGLEDQTEEEILQFPVYAKKLGLLNSAYGIATPYPGTKFYDKLDAKGLIFETKWDRFDEMHSVFKTKHLSSQRIEELGSICLAKFWTLDTFIRKEHMFMKKRGTKLPLIDFVIDRIRNLKFGVGAGIQVQEGNFTNHVKQILKVAVDPNIKKYTEEVGVHNVIEMSRFLNIIGAQTIQITICNDGTPFISFIFKTTKDSVEYVETIDGKIEDTTVDFNFDLKDFNFEDRESKTRIDDARIAIKAIFSKNGIRKQFNAIRLFLAGGVELINYLGMKKGLNGTDRRKRNTVGWRNGGRKAET
jgi:radical SAM superfamily enzyme YgiQ (UPF0313 family)